MARTIDSYRREQAILNSVLEAGTGLVAKFGSAREAKTFRTNCYAFRQLDRIEQAKGFKIGDPRRGTSPYDMIKFELEIDSKKKYYAVKMKNCETLLQVHGVESLVDLDTGLDIAVELSFSPITEGEVSFEEEFEEAVKKAEDKA